MKSVTKTKRRQLMLLIRIFKCKMGLDLIKQTKRTKQRYETSKLYQNQRDYALFDISKKCQYDNIKSPFQTTDDQHKLSKTFMLLVLVWVIAWTPYAMLIVWIICFDAQGVTPIVGLVPVVFCKLSAAGNVMLYGLRCD